MVAVFFDVQRNRLELLAQVRVGGGDALDQLVGTGGRQHCRIIEINFYLFLIKKKLSI
jgi:hypothetical protein